MVATSLTVTPPPFGDDLRRVVRHAGIGVAAGAVVGLVVGGILGRIAMFVLRVTTGESITGVTSDDGFEIGRVTLAGTLNLMLAYSLAGLALGLLYAVARRFLPRRGRVAAWTAVSAAVGGSIFVHSDGVDYLLLDPLWLAVAFFVLLPALAGLGVALAVERLEASGGLARWHVVAAGIGTVALFAVPAAVAAVLLALGRVPVVRRLADSMAVRALALLVVAAMVVVAGAELVAESRVILSR
jgi:hypothetical protein